ncbi:MAG: hypothetical protein U0Q22_11650 [Acidimicrobiales bacterium]
MKVLVVSPHFDDAPLSLGQSLLDGELSGHRVTVGVVYSRSNWTRWFHPTRARWPLATAIRLAEEARNAVRFRYRVRRGGLEEVVLRTGELDSSTFLSSDFDAAASSELPSVLTVLGKWAPSYDVVIAPLGIGDHVDHRLCAEAARRIAADTGAAMAFYEDRPYACVLTEEQLAEAASAIDPRLVRRPVSGPMGPGKHSRIWYPSQFDEFFLTAIALDQENARAEHVWVLPDSPWPRP